MLMSWKLWTVAALVAITGPAARAGDVFQLAQTPALSGEADTLTVGYHRHYRGGAYYRAPFRNYPRYSFSLG
jgi:hypothetical protein